MYEWVTVAVTRNDCINTAKSKNDFCSETIIWKHTYYPDGSLWLCVTLCAKMSKARSISIENELDKSTWNHLSNVHYLMIENRCQKLKTWFSYFKSRHVLFGYYKRGEEKIWFRYLESRGSHVRFFKEQEMCVCSRKDVTEARQVRCPASHKKRPTSLFFGLRTHRFQTPTKKSWSLDFYLQT